MIEQTLSCLCIPLHPTWNMTSTHLAKGHGESARRAPYQPFLIHRAETYSSDLPALAGRILHSLVYLPVIDPLQGQSPSVSSTLLPCCPTHQEINTSLNLGWPPDLLWPQNVAEVVTCQFQAWQHPLLPLETNYQAARKFKTSHWRERPYRDTLDDKTLLRERPHWRLSRSQTNELKLCCPV